MKSPTKTMTALSTIFALQIAAGAAPALAQDDDVGFFLEEIVVTAQKRAQSQQSVPVAVTAITGDNIETMGWDNASDVALQTPNMQVAGPYGDTQPLFSIRGVSMVDYNPNQASPVGVYLDESYLGASFTHGLAMFDLERIEVLRGPQGTLFGKNTTGGAISISTRTPLVDDEANGRLKIGYGNYNELSIDGAAEGTLIEGKLAARVAFTMKKNDGVWENAAGDDMSQTDYWGGRAILNFTPTENFDAVLKVTRIDSSARSMQARTQGMLPGGLHVGLVPANSEVGQRSGSIDRDDAMTDIEATIANLRMTYSTENYDIISVSTYYDTSFVQETDLDGTTANLAHANWLSDQEAFSQDLRIQSNFDGSVNFIIGGYLSREDVDTEVDIIMFNSAALAPVPILGILSQLGAAKRNIEQEKDSIALYAHVDWDITDKMALSGGLRYTEDTNKRGLFTVDRYTVDPSTSELINRVGCWVPGNVIPAPFIPAPPFPYLDSMANCDLPNVAPRENKSTELTGKLALSYQVNDDAMVYGSFSRGYRSGSFNGGLVYNDTADADGAWAEPEFVNAYEFGAKTEFMDNRLRLNMAAFYYDYKDQQFVNQVGVSAIVENAEKAEIKGVEFELMFAATPELTLTAGLGLLDTEYKEGYIADQTTANPADVQSIAGNELLSAPSTNINFAADYDTELGDSFLVRLHVDGNYQSHQWFSAYNGFAGAVDTAKDYSSIGQDAYWLFNARVTVLDIDETYGISLYGKNIFNEKYDAYAIELGTFGLNYYMPGAPRTYGVELSARF